MSKENDSKKQIEIEFFAACEKFRRNIMRIEIKQYQRDIHRLQRRIGAIELELVESHTREREFIDEMEEE